MPHGSREGLLKWLSAWPATVHDPDGLIAHLEAAIWVYREFKRIGKESSSGAVRRNLEAATKAAKALHECAERMDGNSLLLFSIKSRGCFLRQDAARIYVSLWNARQFALTRYPVRGKRRETERDDLADQVLTSLAFTSKRPTTTRGGFFEHFLGEIFKIADGRAYLDLHRLAERACARAKAGYVAPRLIPAIALQRLVSAGDNE